MISRLLWGFYDMLVESSMNAPEDAAITLLSLKIKTRTWGQSLDSECTSK